MSIVKDQNLAPAGRRKINWALLLKLLIYSNKPLFICQVRKMVTRTGFEPMLTA